VGDYRILQSITKTSYEKTNKASQSRQEIQATRKRHALVPWHSNGESTQEEVNAEFSTIEAVVMSIAAAILLAWGLVIIYKAKV
jgi:hypothetical protein